MRLECYKRSPWPPMTLCGNPPTTLCFSMGQRGVCRQERPFRFLEMDKRDEKRAIAVVLLAFGGRKQHLPLTVDMIFYLPSVYTWWTQVYYHTLLAGWWLMEIRTATSSSESMKRQSSVRIGICRVGRGGSLDGKRAGEDEQQQHRGMF